MSDLSATNCGCGCDDGRRGNSCGCGNDCGFACGSSYYSSAVADVAMAAVVMVAVVTTAACGSSYYSSAVADLEMDAVMDADVDAVMTVAKP